ncbi:MAG: Gfo/Idh/MocA family oxidoreductase [Candidatus Staskawiczbacteria bacterium]|nr:Gfo/Idh/MocA family oxidoreductase [Candidatus Staskawiczbacteria bacterium]
MKKILIIGGGSIGKRHLKNLFFLGEKDITMVEVNQERAVANKKEFIIEVFTSLKDVENKKFDICFVCSPSVYHLENSLWAAKRGYDLFIEKPLSNNLDKVDDLIKMCQSKKIITMVGSNWKFYPLFQKMKELIDGGVIGKILSARCQFGQYLPDWHPWEDYKQGYSANKKLGGGVLLDSHEFDYLSWFLGDVKKISCFAKKISNLEIDVEDVAEVILEFKNGAIGEIHLDYLQRFNQRNFEFFGESGTIIWDTNLKKVVLQTKDKGKEEFALDHAYDINQMYIDETKYFLDCVDKKQETFISVEKGEQILKLIMAAKKSSQKDKSVYL